MPTDSLKSIVEPKLLIECTFIIFNCQDYLTDRTIFVQKSGIITRIFSCRNVWRIDHWILLLR